MNRICEQEISALTDPKTLTESSEPADNSPPENNVYQLHRRKSLATVTSIALRDTHEIDHKPMLDDIPSEQLKEKNA